jgi:hypothetical protein
MIEIRKATGSYNYDILFVSFVLLGRFFILNLMFAV